MIDYNYTETDVSDGSDCNDVMFGKTHIWPVCSTK